MMSGSPLTLVQRAQSHGWLLIIFGFFAFLVWAALYPMDQGIPGSGFLISKAERIQVVAPSTGLVSKLARQAGDSVKQGDVLLEYDAKPLEANERSAKESMLGIEVSNASLNAALNARNIQVNALRSQFEASLKLVEAGFTSASALATTQSQLYLAESEALELRSRIEQNEYRLRELKERIEAMRHEKALLRILSPANGKVMNTSIKFPGVNITVGNQVMEIVPDSEHLLIDARIPVDYATRAHIGMPVDVMFPTLPGSSTARIKGKIEYLSADRITDARTSQVYLEGRVSLDDPLDATRLNLRAGLPATVLLKTGPRTLLSYITRPLTERLSKGLQ